MLTRRLSTASAALAAGLVFAVLPRVTWMGIEGRSYAMTAAVAVWLTVLFVSLLRRREVWGEDMPHSYRPLAAVTILAGAGLSLAVVNVVRDNRKKALRLASENEALREALRDSNLEIASRLVGRLGQRDGYAAAHAAASAVYAADIAEESASTRDAAARYA